MTKRDILHHRIYYFLLILILSGGVLLAIQASSDRKLQTLIITLTTFLYVFVGMVHHVLNHDFTIKIMIEYILMGTLGITIILFLMKGGLV